MRDYNRNNTALFSVITDGQEWRFYYSQTGGEFAQKCFMVVDLVRDDLAEVERTLSKFLSREEIDNGNAKAEAEKHLQLNQRQRAMDDCLPAARRHVQEPPYPSLPESLAALVRERGVTITRDEAITYISIAGEVTVRSVATVPESSGILSIGATARPVTAAETVRMVAPDNLGELKHVRVLEGSLGSVSETKWIKLVAAGVRLSLDKGISLQELEAALEANLEKGNRGDSGFALIADTDVSMQGMDAIHCAGNLFVLARLLRCPLRVKFRWGKKAAFPGQVGVLEWKP